MNHTMDEFVSFARFVATAVVDEDFEVNAGAFAELFCRRLRSLGIVTDDEKNWNFTASNADRIRSMTDEELAKKISGIEQFALTVDGAWSPEQWLDWLKQEAVE